MARILIVGGGCRGLELTRALVDAGHAVRVTTRGEHGRAAIEATGAQCWIGDPDRIASLRLALDGVTIAGWLLGTASGAPEAVQALHGSRLRFMLGQLIDTTVRGLIYEAAGSVDAEILTGAAALAREQCELNSIPLEVLTADPSDGATWLMQAGAAVSRLLGSSSTAPPPV